MRGYVDTNTHTCTHARRYKHTCACTHTNNSHMSVYTFVEPGTEAHPSLITSYEVPILANYLKWTMIGQFWYNISSHEINKEIPDKDRNKEIEIYCRLSTSTMFFASQDVLSKLGQILHQSKDPQSPKQQILPDHFALKHSSCRCLEKNT